MNWCQQAVRVFSLCLLLLAPPAAYAQILRDRHVIVIALDAAGSDTLYRYVFKGEGNPLADSFLRQLSDGAFRKHVRAQNAWAIFPSATFAAWATIFTGVYPGKHGMASGDFYARDVDKELNFGAHPGLSSFLGCSVPVSITQYGWDLDCAGLWLAITSAAVSPFGADPYNLGNLIEKLPDPRPWVWPIFSPFPFPVTVINTNASGGSANEALLVRTVYDFLRERDLRTYVVHNFYAHSNLTALGQRVAWDTVYGSDLALLDQLWGRPTYEEVRAAVVLAAPSDYKILDKAAVNKTIAYIQQNGLPHVLTVYLAAVDSESHQYKKFGHATLEDAQFSAVRFIDQQLVTLHTYLKTRPEYSKTIFVLIADHGQTPNHKQVLQHLPPDQYRVLDDGYMAYVYLKNSRTGKWTDAPEASDAVAFLSSVASDLSLVPANDLQTIMARDSSGNTYQPYRWDGHAWVPVDFTALEDSPYGYLEPEKRIQGVNNPKRSGDFILLPGCAAGSGCSAGMAFSDTPGAHGSLRPGDSEVPFYVFGEPVSQAISGASPWVLCGASQIDVTPTILGLFGAYQMHRSALDGKPLLDSELRVNLTDFAPCQPGGVSDFLLGTWRNFQGEVTETLLHNPSTVDRDAVLLYYGWDENFLGCQVVRITPHGYLNIAPQVEGGGPLEIRAGRVRKEPRPAGLTGYSGRRVDGKTEGFEQLAPSDPELFDLQKTDAQEVSQCACSLLQQRGAPLGKVFCNR